MFTHRKGFMAGVRVARAVCALLASGAAAAWAEEPATYRNPLPVAADGEAVESCADPSVVEDGASGWVMYCTTDPLSGRDRDAAGDLAFHLIPTFRSADLVRWTYAGDVFDRVPGTNAREPPAWAADSALFWAPEGKEIGGRHYLLFGVTDLRDGASGEPGCASDGAIGYAVSDSPAGPWTPADEPLVEPRRGGAGCDFLWTYDPEVVATPEGRQFLYYGSYYGGIEVRELSVAADGTLRADPATAVPVTIPNRYEGAEVVLHGGAWWLFVSASNCCNGPQTGYGVFVGRAEDPRGPFLDREGVSLLDARVGGTPVLMQSGNGFVGPGHNTVLRDAAGQWWTLYHAVEESAPWFGDEVGFTRRPVLLDRLDWAGGWPVVPGGPSGEARPVPVVAPASGVAAPAGEVPQAGAGAVVAQASDDFDGVALREGWSWIREPEEGEVALAAGALEVSVSDTDLWEDRNDAPVLLRQAPEGDFVAEAKVALDVPPEGCCHNYVQAGLVLYAGDDEYLKLVVVSIWETRQTEFAREVSDDPRGWPRYGSSVAGPPGEDWTWLRLALRREPEGEAVTAWTSRDGERWVRGATWRHDLGEMRLGLVAMGGPGGFTARFDHLRVFALGD